MPHTRTRTKMTKSVISFLSFELRRLVPVLLLLLVWSLIWATLSIPSAHTYTRAYTPRPPLNSMNMNKRFCTVWQSSFFVIIIIYGVGFCMCNEATRPKNSVDSRRPKKKNTSTTQRTLPPPPSRRPSTVPITSKAVTVRSWTQLYVLARIYLDASACIACGPFDICWCCSCCYIVRPLHTCYMPWPLHTTRRPVAVITLFNFFFLFSCAVCSWKIYYLPIVDNMTTQLWMWKVMYHLLAWLNRWTMGQFRHIHKIPS